VNRQLARLSVRARGNGEHHAVGGIAGKQRRDLEAAQQRSCVEHRARNAVLGDDRVEIRELGIDELRHQVDLVERATLVALALAVQPEEDLVARAGNHEIDGPVGVSFAADAADFSQGACGNDDGRVHGCRGR